jgi:hypothetical protein
MKDAQLALRVRSFGHLIFRKGYEASQLCGLANCLNPEYLVTGDHDIDDDRKSCHANMFYTEVLLNKQMIRLNPLWSCCHTPICVSRFVLLMGLDYEMTLTLDLAELAVTTEEKYGVSFEDIKDED